MRTVLSASTLQGNEVRNVEGEKLGEVKDIMLDTGDGGIAYYVLSFGGFLGMGDKLFAIPPQAMEVDTEERVFIMDVEKERLKNAPGFDKDNWPNMADTQFRDEVYAHYGYEYRQMPGR